MYIPLVLLTLLVCGCKIYINLLSLNQYQLRGPPNWSIPKYFCGSAHFRLVQIHNFDVRRVVLTIHLASGGKPRASLGNLSPRVNVRRNWDLCGYLPMKSSSSGVGLPLLGNGLLVLRAGYMPSRRSHPLRDGAIPSHRHSTTPKGIPAAQQSQAAASAPVENEWSENAP